MHKSIQFHKKNIYVNFNVRLQFEMLSLNSDFDVIIYIFINIQWKWFELKKRLLLTTTRFTEIQANQLHHVGLQQIYIPPWNSFRFRQWTCIWCIKCWCWTINGFLWDSSTFCWNLHGCFASRYIQHCKCPNSKEKCLNYYYIDIFM